MKTEFKLCFALVIAFVTHVLAKINEVDSFSEDAFLFINCLILALIVSVREVLAGYITVRAFVTP